MPDATNFIDLFLQAAGSVRFPRKYFYWSAISLVSAALQNRVWLEQITYSRLFPNLYIFLVGPSASGKSKAIEIANGLAESAITQFQIPLNVFRGTITHSAVFDELQHGPLYLVSNELSRAFRTGDLGREMIAVTTDLYEGHAYTPYSDRTRGSGKKTIIAPCLTWIGASTTETLMKYITDDDVKSGFFGRICCALVKHSEWVRLRREHRTHIDDTEVFYQLQPTLLNMLARLMWGEYSGELVFSDEARMHYMAWRQTRGEPAYEALDATWERQPATVLKLAMIHHMARLPEDCDPRRDEWMRTWYIIEKPCVEQAIRDVESLTNGAFYFVDRAIITYTNPGLQRAMVYLENNGEAWEPDIKRQFRSHREWLEVRDQLISLELVNIEPYQTLSGKVKYKYIWIAGSIPSEKEIANIRRKRLRS